MKTWFATLVYTIVLLFLVICAGAIVFKLLFFPPCTPVGPHGSLCVVDGWSIAGLAGTVLAVAATVVAFIGAAAIAYWWIKIDERVDEQVKKLFNAQKASLTSEFDKLLEKQKREINSQNLILKSLTKDLYRIRREADKVFELMFDIATSSDPSNA